MVDAGLSPDGPVRWWLAYAVEREYAEQQRDQTQQDDGDIEVL